MDACAFLNSLPIKILSEDDFNTLNAQCLEYVCLTSLSKSMFFKVEVEWLLEK